MQSALTVRSGLDGLGKVWLFCVYHRMPTSILISDPMHVPFYDDAGRWGLLHARLRPAVGTGVSSRYVGAVFLAVGILFGTNSSVSRLERNRTDRPLSGLP